VNDLFKCEQPGDYPFYGSREVGVRVFHSQIAAMAVAAYTNRTEGKKVKRVVMDQGHFRVRWAR